MSDVNLSWAPKEAVHLDRSRLACDVHGRGVRRMGTASQAEALQAANALQTPCRSAMLLGYSFGHGVSFVGFLTPLVPVSLHLWPILVQHSDSDIPPRSPSSS
jgi:hypothetical protein